MSPIELLLRTLRILRPILPGLAAVLAATLAAMTGLYLLCRDVWVQDKRFRLAGLFFGLSRRGCLCLACSWIKLIFLFVFVLGFQKLSLLHYLMVLFPGAILALAGSGARKRAGALLWLGLQLEGLLCANLICGYILDLNAGIGFLLVYGAMGVFLLLFSVYLFLTELAAISGQRDLDAKKFWRADGAER